MVSIGRLDKRLCLPYLSTYYDNTFCSTIILQTTSIVASKINPIQLTKPVNACENCFRHVKTRGLHVKTGTRHGYVPTQKVQASVLLFPPKHSGIPVNGTYDTLH